MDNWDTDCWIRIKCQGGLLFYNLIFIIYLFPKINLSTKTRGILVFI